MNFSELNLKKELQQSLQELEFTAPTPIQELVIPVALAGSDCMAEAQTGSGKTLAFALPLLNMIEHGKGVQALVLVPTRELALQVATDFKSLSKHLNVKTVVVYGGVGLENQVRDLQTASIVVGTPGRVIDHLKRRSLRLENCRFAVLDEADRMLDMGFIDDVTFILKQTADHRQVMLFSATLNDELQNIIRNFAKNPKRLSVIGDEEAKVGNVTQHFLALPKEHWYQALNHLLKTSLTGQIIIFCRTKHETSRLADGLERRGFKANALHGDLSQSRRDRVMRDFKDKMFDVLVATDVAARGIHVENVGHVVSLGVPDDITFYVHRIGRVGRAGAHGDSWLMVSPKDAFQLRNLEQMTGLPFKEEKLDIEFKDNEQNAYKGHGSRPGNFQRRSFGGGGSGGRGGGRGFGGNRGGSGGHGGGRRFGSKPRQN